jgi:2Fe-2S ferredoxin
MITIHVTGRDGVRGSFEIPTDEPLMFALRDDAGLPVEGACGGNATCGTCHVIFPPDWLARLDPPQDYELAMLDMLEHRGERSRLACQIPVSETLDGAELQLGPEE